MGRRVRFLILGVALILWTGCPILGAADDWEAHTGEPGAVVPGNTVILANRMDARFSRDFSSLLKQLRLEWAVLDSAAVPDSVRDKNVILLGHPDTPITGELVGGLLTAEEIEMIRTGAGHHVVIETASPWMEGRSIFICAGADALLTRNAAEEAVRAAIAGAPPASDWIRSRYDSGLDEGVRDYVDQLRFSWDDEELPLSELTMDVRAKPRRGISAQQATEDVERLFYLLSHGYAGYAYFNQQEEFEQAKARILQELSSQSNWAGDAFSSLLYDHLSFIVDCHMRIGDYQFATHRDFWYDTELELAPGSDGYGFALDGTSYSVAAINDGDPVPFILPSLNRQGEPIYRLGLLSSGEPAPLLLTATSEAGERQFEIELERSDFAYYSEDIFREDVIGGIPVVRARSFSDRHEDELNRFLETATNRRGEPAIIVDIRGNGGGNERWPIGWIQRLTGRRAEAVFVTSELESKTSMIGRANANAYWNHLVPDTPIFGQDAERFTRLAEAFESGTRTPSWTGPYYPAMPLIANDTTVVVVTNGLVASAGEGLVLRISQAENVVLVGENTLGCLTFGNISIHQLPNSKLRIQLPINFGLFLDMEFREEVGLAPDLWVPAADAVNYAVAAIRRGTITTSRPLPSTVLQQEFIPENTLSRDIQKWIRFLLIVAFFGGSASVWAYFVRGKPQIVTSAGAVWLVFAALRIARQPENPVGFGFLLAGVVCLVWGGRAVWGARRNRA
jgi:C-terminal processing protease CtpA/Prc